MKTGWSLLTGIFVLVFSWEGALAARITVDHGTPGKVILRSEKCEDLKEQVKALKIWLAKSNHTLEIKDSDYKKDLSLADCEVNLGGKLPAPLEKVLENQHTCDGPNCWNSALVHNNILPYFRFTTTEEMTFWMNSPLCREKKVHEPMAPGDIIAIREKGKTKDTFEEVHGFTYMTDDLTFSKNGYSKSSKYSLYSMEDVMIEYGVSMRCARHYKIPSDKKCKVYANVYTCKPFAWPEEKKAEAKKPKKDKDPEKEKLIVGDQDNDQDKDKINVIDVAALKGTGEILGDLECKLQKMAWESPVPTFLKKKKDDYPAEEFFQSSLDTIKGLAKNHSQKIDEELQKNGDLFSSLFNRKKIGQLKEHKFFWDSLYQRANAALEQKSYISKDIFGPK